MSDIDSLTEDLFSIYTTTGREVTYVDDRGNRRPYWPNRYLQALKRAVNEDGVVEFVERLVTREDATRGFGYLQDANRLDLTVEALVADDAKPYHHLFTENAVLSSRARLLEASDVWQLGTKINELRMHRDRLIHEIAAAEKLLAFAEEHGFQRVADAEAALAEERSSY